MRQADARSLLFARGPVGGRTNETTALEHLQRLVSPSELAPSVPDFPRSGYQLCRSIFLDGLYRYELFTVAAERALLLLEGVLGARLVEYYEGQVPLVHRARGARASIAVHTFLDLVEVLQARPRDTGPRRVPYRHRRFGDDSWDLEGHVEFDGSLRSLLRWARDIGLLVGQRGRVAGEALVGLRNLAAHPDFPSVIGPPDAALLISDVGEITNRLWGSDTPGGRIYPASLAAARFAVCQREDGGRMVAPVDLLADADQEERSGRWSLVETWELEHLTGWHPDVELTRYPVRLLARDVGWDELLVLVGSLDSAVAPVDEWRDRLFFVRRSASGFEAPRTAAQVRTLAHATRDVPEHRWLAIRADHPGDVIYFLEDELTRSMPPDVEAGSEHERRVLEWWERRREHFAVRIVRDNLTWQEVSLMYGFLEEEV